MMICKSRPMSRVQTFLKRREFFMLLVAQNSPSKKGQLRIPNARGFVPPIGLIWIHTVRKAFCSENLAPLDGSESL